LKLGCDKNYFVILAREKMAVNYKPIKIRLQHEYVKLGMCNLVKTKKVTDESLSFFITHLNIALPYNENENHQMQVFKDLYKTNNAAVIDIVLSELSDNNKIAHYILWTTADDIISHFGLTDVIDLKWDRERHKYRISAAGSEAESIKPKYQKPYDRNSKNDGAKKYNKEYNKNTKNKSIHEYFPSAKKSVDVDDAPERNNKTPYTEDDVAVKEETTKEEVKKEEVKKEDVVATPMSRVYGKSWADED
jgi:hypothetical protein